jgi:hypothetical protein
VNRNPGGQMTTSRKRRADVLVLPHASPFASDSFRSSRMHDNAQVGSLMWSPAKARIPVRLCRRVVWIAPGYSDHPTVVSDAPDVAPIHAKGAVVKGHGTARRRNSNSPRRVEPVSQLARDLREAAEWRNNLPVIAHTLAKSWALRGGARPMEIDELRRALDVQRAMVLDSYAAGATDMHAADNWMLLSAIDAVHAGDLGLADYHFRWFDSTQARRHAGG